MPRCGPISACQRLGAFKGPLRSPFACTGRDLPLPRPLKGTMLSSKPRGSGECRVKAKDAASLPPALRSLVKLQRGDDP